MIRLLFWLAVIILVVAAIRSKFRSAVRRQQDAMSQGASTPAPGPAPAAEAMAQCAHCGLHFPSSEAVRADGLDYCSPQHVRLPPK
jgi:uncharacterized protein